MNFKEYLEKKLIYKSSFIKRRSKEYLKKSRNNLIVTSVLLELTKKDKIKKELGIPEDFSAGEWIAIIGYYSMYMASLALLAKVGYVSKNHTATIVGLEEFFVKKRYLEKKYIDLLKESKLQKETIDNLIMAREKREIAQYSITKETTKIIAKEILENAYKFIDVIENLIKKIEIEQSKGF